MKAIVKLASPWQSAGPIREPWQPVELEFQFKGSEFGHWKVKGGRDAFAFRHPSLGQTDVYRLLESEAHHHKISPVGTGRLIAMVGVVECRSQRCQEFADHLVCARHHAAHRQEQK